MSGKQKNTDGICILSFDNGGPGAYSQLLILGEYMGRMASDLQVAKDDVYPADYFDLIGGVGFGGFIAFMLGYLRMNVNQAIEALLSVTATIFIKGSDEVVDREANSTSLRQFVEGMLRARGISLDTKMNDKHYLAKRSKVALYAASSANLTHPHVFRTYRIRGLDLNPAIVRAVCATISIPSHFSPVKIGSSKRHQSFVGCALGANNPTRLLLNEASMVYGKERRVAQIFSLGCGLARVLSVRSSGVADIHKLLKDVAVDCEAVSNELSTRLFDIDAYVRLNVDRGMEDVTMEDWNDLGTIESHTEAYIAKFGVSSALDRSLGSMKERIGSITLGQLIHSSKTKSTAKKAPSVSPYFVTRKGPWEMMVDQLTSPSLEQKIFPITGMGGCGKTQLVSYFLKQHPGLYKRVVYVDASSSSSIKTDLQTWVRTLRGEYVGHVWEDALGVLNSAPNDEKWALILDNADDPGLDLVPFLPKNLDITIIITSRNRDTGSLSTTHHLELGKMTDKEALAVLLKAARRHLPLSEGEMESAQALINELGGLAVALVQAGTYCYRLSSTVGDALPYTFAQYLSLFASHRAELMKKAEPMPLDSYERGVYTTLDLSYKELPQAPRGFLHLISSFHHTDIPLEAFATAANNGFEDQWFYLPRSDSHNGIILELKQTLCNSGEWNELWVHEIIQTLQSFSLLTTTSINDSIFLNLHPLIQKWCRDMDPSASAQFKAMSTQMLTASLNKDNTWRDRNLLPHILNTLSHTELNDLHVNDLMAFVIVLQEMGHYQTAARLVHHAQEVVEASAGSDSVATLGVYSWIGNIYIREGKWYEAERLLETVLQKNRRVLGMEHPATLSTAGKLAKTFAHRGRYKDAERLEVEVLEQKRRIMGMEHPDTITAAGNLALTYADQRRYAEAEKLGVEVLEQRRRILGMEHPDTIIAAENLAMTYRDEERYEEAEKLGLEVLEQRGRILGVEHPDTVRATANLAATYGSQSKWNEAEELRIKVLEQQRRILGMEHPHTILTMANLAVEYGNQGRWEEDVALLAPAVQLSLKVLGREHRHTRDRINWIVSVYNILGKEKEAEEMKSLLP